MPTNTAQAFLKKFPRPRIHASLVRSGHRKPESRERWETTCGGSGEKEEGDTGERGTTQAEGGREEGGSRLSTGSRPSPFLKRNSSLRL